MGGMCHDGDFDGKTWIKCGLLITFKNPCAGDNFIVLNLVNFQSIQYVFK